MTKLVVRIKAMAMNRNAVHDDAAFGMVVAPVAFLAGASREHLDVIPGLVQCFRDRAQRSLCAAGEVGPVAECNHRNPQWLRRLRRTIIHPRTIEHPRNLSSQVFGIIRSKCQSCGGHRFRQRGSASGHNGQSTRHGLDHGNTESLVPRRHHEHVGRMIGVAQPLVINLPEQVQPIGKAQFFRERPAAAGLGFVNIPLVANDHSVYRRSPFTQPRQ